MKKIFILTLALCVFISSQAFAIYPKGSHAEAKAGEAQDKDFVAKHLEMINKEIELSDEQKAKIEMLFEMQMAKQKEIEQQKRVEMHALFASTNENIRLILTEIQKVAYDKLMVQQHSDMVEK